MKHFFYLFVLSISILAIESCKKADEPAPTAISIVGKWLPQLYEGTFTIKKSTGDVVTVNAKFDATKPNNILSPNGDPVEYLADGRVKNSDGAFDGTYKITGTMLQTKDANNNISELQISEATSTKLVLKGDFNKLSDNDKGGLLFVLVLGDPNSFAGVNTNKDVIQSGIVTLTSKKM